MVPTQNQLNASRVPERDEEIEEKIRRGELVVTDRTQAGRIINEMFKEWDQLQRGAVPGKKLRPWFRGRSLCLLYFNNEPVITIGPDFKCSLFELVITNTIMFLVIRGQHNIQHLWYLSVIVVALKNVAFILTVLANPGMLARDPRLHQRSYLRHIADYD